MLAFAGLQAFALGANWDMELARLKILAEDGPEALRALDHAYPADHPLSVPVAAAAGPAMDRLADDLAAFASAAPSPGGSNNWAIAGARTASGVPLLANDPHLAARLPAPWYLAHLRCPEWEVAGASFVGGPVFPIAHNGHAAWGITAGMTDQADLFIEEIGDDGASRPRGLGDGAPARCVDEVIEVRGGDTVTERVLLTPPRPDHLPVPGRCAGGPVAVGDLAAPDADPRLPGLPARPRLRNVPARVSPRGRGRRSTWSTRMPMATSATSWSGSCRGAGAATGRLPLPGWLEDVGWEAELVPFDRDAVTLPIPRSASWRAPTTARPRMATRRSWARTGWTATAMARIVEELAKRARLGRGWLRWPCSWT